MLSKEYFWFNFGSLYDILSFLVSSILGQGHVRRYFFASCEPLSDVFDII